MGAALSVCWLLAAGTGLSGLVAEREGRKSHVQINQTLLETLITDTLGLGMTAEVVALEIRISNECAGKVTILLFFLFFRRTPVSNATIYVF